MNPFEYKDRFNSPEMKALFKELNDITSRICLQHAEEAGEEYSHEALSCSLQGTVEFTSVWFKTAAFHKFAIQPETTLPMNERVAIAAHEAYKQVAARG
ncbi:hypothetical protein PP425_gp089 [Enterobacter phage vB_EclM_Q7622]|uniref:hypothetical protein n=1 Tax=Enterobacter phage vB_EclM_Q7622 TaxID=2908628 RepID=UPI0023290EF8|nr:hypothetical protein PP425_gp089 [Enterobacter phage vB_EclM_Q7622]UIS65604.1 hypothetical protein Q76222_00089 [Enterobacter phage vB_EclM_Q7622]